MCIRDSLDIQEAEDETQTSGMLQENVKNNVGRNRRKDKVVEKYVRQSRPFAVSRSACKESYQAN